MTSTKCIEAALLSKRAGFLNNAKAFGHGALDLLEMILNLVRKGRMTSTSRPTPYTAERWRSAGAGASGGAIGGAGGVGISSLLRNLGAYPNQGPNSPQK